MLKSFARFYNLTIILQHKTLQRWEKVERLFESKKTFINISCFCFYLIQIQI